MIYEAAVTIGGGCSVGRGGVSQGGSDLCYRGCSVGHWCHCLSIGRGGVGHGGSYFSYGGCKSLLVNDGVESVVGVCGVLDGTTGAVGLHQAVAALNDVSVAGFMLAFRIAGQSVLDVVSVAVLGVRVVVSVDGYGGGNLSDGGGCICQGSSDLSDGGGSIGQRSVS